MKTSERIVKRHLERLYELTSEEDFHNQHTPFEICDEMLGKIEGINSDMEILVMFNLEFIYKLKERFGREGMTNIWLLTPSEEKKNFAISLGISENHIRIYSYKDKRIIGEENMPKFDVVVGNPPYLKGAHLKFLKLALRSSNKYVLFIQPATWLINEKPNQRNGIEKELREEIQDYDVRIDLHNGKTLFPDLHIGSYLSILSINKKGQNNILVHDHINGTSHSYKKILDVSKYGNSSVYISLKNKILSFGDNIDNHRKEKIKNFVINIAEIRGHTSRDPNKIFENDFYTLLPEDRKIETKKTHPIYFSFEEEYQAKNFLNYLKTNFVRFCLSIYKINTQLIKGEIAAIPWLDFSKEWTDEKLYIYFNLSKDEIEFIEKNIPGYYQIGE